jgi:hypothetical protein
LSRKPAQSSSTSRSLSEEIILKGVIFKTMSHSGGIVVVVYQTTTVAIRYGIKAWDNKL